MLMRLSGSCVIIARLLSSFRLGEHSSCGLATVAKRKSLGDYSVMLKGWGCVERAGRQDQTTQLAEYKLCRGYRNWPDVQASL